MKNIIVPCVMLLSLTAPKLSMAQDDPFAFKVARAGDLELTCQQLVQEASLMRDIIQTTEDTKSDANFNGHAITAVGAIGSFLVGTVTGGLGLAAAGFLVSQEVEGGADQAESVQDIASQRRALMMGIHQAKTCDQAPMKIAMQRAEEKSIRDISAERFASIETASGPQNELDFND